MSSAVTVSGAPALTLSDGGTAIYASGSGTNTLNFSYTVSASNVSTSALAVTGVQLPTGASITDGSGNPAILVGASHTFNNIVVDTTPVSAPVFGSYTANANGSVTISGTAAPNTTVHEIQQVYSGGVTLNLDGTATVNASGNWTYTTPSLINGTWNGFTAYDENSLGDVSATVTNNGTGISTNMLPSPVIESTAVKGNAVTLSGVIPTAYGGTGPAGATVLIYDGATKLGSTTTTTGGAWSFTTSTLANGAHSFAAESQNSYGASASSIPIPITLTSLSAAPGVAPTITGTVAGRATTSEAAVKPFSGVTIADANSGASDTLTISVTGAGGTLSGTGLTGGTGGVYTLTGTAAAITSELGALSFTPKAGSPGTSSTTNFRLSDLSSAYATATVNTTTSVVDTDPAGALSLSVAQATALETAGGSAPTGDVVTLSDTAANIQGLTAAQIGGLKAIGVTAIAATNASVSLSVAQTSAVNTAGLSVSAPANDIVTEHNADGSWNFHYYTTITFQGVRYASYNSAYTSSGFRNLATYYGAGGNVLASESFATNGSYSITVGGVLTQQKTVNADGSYAMVYNGVTGQAYTSYQRDYTSKGVLLARAVNDTNGAGVTTVYGNNLQISTSAGAESLTSGSDIFVYTPHANEIFSAAGTTNDVFTFTAGFGSDTISGLGAAGANAIP